MNRNKLKKYLLLYMASLEALSLTACTNKEEQSIESEITYNDNSLETPTSTNSKEIKSIKINKGITLISLVVTIIIILILAGVTIQVAVGESGLITKALDAVKGIKGARFQENVELALGEFRIDTALDKDGKENLKTIIEGKTAEVTEKKSRFIANIFHVENVTEADEKIKQINNL